MAYRELTYAQALLEAIELKMAADPSVYVMGLGVPDPKGIFGTTLGLQKKFGERRVMDMPTSENGMTGVAIGSALVGMRPVMTHQRIDFALLAVEQIVNQAAKWHYMFGGKMRVPLVIRLILGRGWGQGPQHSQSLQAMFAHIPGLRVVMPTTAHDAKGLLIASIEDNNPVIFIEHRWLHYVKGDVPVGLYRVPLGEAKIVRAGRDVTIAALSYMTLEALRAAEMLEKDGVSCEVIDVRSVAPFDERTVLDSVQKTGRLLVADTGWTSGGFSAEILSRVAEKKFTALKSAPVRVGLPDIPTPTSQAFAAFYYPRAVHLVAAVRKTIGLPLENLPENIEGQFLDVPDPAFQGPF